MSLKMTNRPNILLITADQWRGDCLGTLGHPVVKTPNLDAFAETATLFEQHYSATAPCSPARASLYTGLYQMNHRVVRNGAPLDDRFDNIARAARRSGYLPTLFGYTDTSPDPRLLDPNDPALLTYEGVLPGFKVGQYLPEDDKPWLSWLAARGHDPQTFSAIHKVDPEPGQRISRRPPRYSKHETQTAFLTDAFLTWLSEQEEAESPWMAHVSYLRPHPPLAAPEPYNEMYDAEDGAGFAGAAAAELEAALHPVVAALQENQRVANHIPSAKGNVRDLSRVDLKRIRAIYYGMITEVDAHLGRIFKALENNSNTLVIFTSDHAEMMGDHWMLGKGGFYRQSYHIPLMIRTPGAGKPNRVSAYTSSIDIFPTLLEYFEVDPEHSPDGESLSPYLSAQTPVSWRDAAFWEFDCRDLMAKFPDHFPAGARPSSPALMSRLGPEWQFVHFSGASGLLLNTEDRAESPENQADSHPDIVRHNLEMLLDTRMRHNDETLARSPVWEYYS